MDILIQKITNPLKGKVHLSGSKSISNRLLIIQALAKEKFDITALADADDTKVLQSLLESDNEIHDVHHAGTSYRFLCSYLCLQEGEQLLTGSARMLQRPIKPLVDALTKLGAEISYEGEEGFPPLRIGESNWKRLEKPLEIDATISSQFITSLLLIAPSLPYGLHLQLMGNLVSRPYIEMTLNLMARCGVQYSWNDDAISIEKQEYKAEAIEVEADWSAASYYYGLVSAVKGSEIELLGLHEKSIQGDSAIKTMMEGFGVASTFKDSVLCLKRIDQKASIFEYDFVLQPDLAQTISATSACLGINGLFSGLQTLAIKETDRITALQNELAKFEVYLSKLPAKFSRKSDKEYFMQEGKIQAREGIEIETYQDHRMAMSLAILAANSEITIKDSEVVSKSYPGFWEDLESIGISLQRKD